MRLTWEQFKKLIEDAIKSAKVPATERVYIDSFDLTGDDLECVITVVKSQVDGEWEVEVTS